MTNTMIQKTDLERLEELHRELDIKPPRNTWDVESTIGAREFLRIADDVFKYYSEMLGQHLTCMAETHTNSTYVRADVLTYQGLESAVKWHPTINLYEVINTIANKSKMNTDFEDQYREWQNDNGREFDGKDDIKVIREIGAAMGKLNDQVGITVGFSMEHNILTFVRSSVEEYMEVLDELVQFTNEERHQYGPTYYAAKFISQFFNTFGYYSVVIDPDW